MSKEDLIKELKKRDITIAALSNTSNEEKEPKINISLKNKYGNHSLDLDAIKRYSRQLILPELGPNRQMKLLNSSVIIVGCGGLGCPAAIYLAAAGVGFLGLVDFDDVEISNLHRQILHTERGIGESKVDSVIKAVRNLNSAIKCTSYKVSLSSQNIMDIISKFDLVLDCTDNVATRYLLNDACILSSKPLVSGSALRFEGQLTVYGFKDGPCYRCLFPEPPPPESVTNCSDGGVLGVVPGIIGCLQALESIKILINHGEICSGFLLLMDASSLSFRKIKLRGRQSSCKLCGSSPVIKTLIDYEKFCGSTACDKDSNLHLVEDSNRISVSDLKRIRDDFEQHVLIDVRPENEVEICSLSDSLNVPLSRFDEDGLLDEIAFLSEKNKTKYFIFICKRGNDSQKAMLKFRKKFNNDFTVVDVRGGLSSWSKVIDPDFPIY